MKTERGILIHIFNMNFQFWAVLGSEGCRERKKNPNCPKYGTFRGSFFMFSWAKKILIFFFKNIAASALKSCIISFL